MSLGAAADVEGGSVEGLNASGSLRGLCWVSVGFEILLLDRPAPESHTYLPSSYQPPFDWGSRLLPLVPLPPPPPLPQPAPTTATLT